MKIIKKEIEYNCTAYDITVLTTRGKETRLILIELYLDFKMLKFFKKRQQKDKIETFNKRYSYLCCAFTENFIKKVSYKSFFGNNLYLTKKTALIGSVIKADESLIRFLYDSLGWGETNNSREIKEISSVEIVLNNSEVIALICRMFEERYHFIDIDTMLEIRKEFINCKLKNHVAAY